MKVRQYNGSWVERNEFRKYDSKYGRKFQVLS